MTPQVHYLTQSPSKIAAIRAVLEPDYEVVVVDADVPEIQAATSLEIARHQAVAAAQLLGVPVAREDHQTGFAALHGMPGPFAAYVEPVWPVEYLLELIEGRDRSGAWELAMAYAEPSGACVTFTHRVEFTLSIEPRGDARWNWPRAMMLPGETRTLAEYPELERLSTFAANYHALKAHLDARG